MLLVGGRAYVHYAEISIASPVWSCLLYTIHCSANNIVQALLVESVALFLFSFLTARGFFFCIGFTIEKNSSESYKYKMNIH